MKLLIGNRNYSTWSLRPWLVLKRCKAEFTVREIDIYSPEGQAELERISPSRLVPLLNVEGETIWDSMAISVWCAERYPDAKLWPADAHARWLARSAACEMHGGFMGLRTDCSMGPDHTMVGPDRSPTHARSGSVMSMPVEQPQPRRPSLMVYGLLIVIACCLPALLLAGL